MEAKARATDKILASAVSVLGTRSPDQVTLEDIAAKAGLSRGLIIYHFGSLSGLTTVVYDYLYFRLRQIWLQPSVSLLTACLAWAELLEEEPDLFRLFGALSFSHQQTDHRLDEFRQELQGLIREYFFEINLPGSATAAMAFCGWWEGTSLQALASEQPGQFFRDRTRQYLSWIATISS